MKDSNIVVALNRTLTEYFDTPCVFSSFVAAVATNTHFQLGVLQGRYEASVVFYTNKELPTGGVGFDSTHVTSSEVISTGTCDFYKHHCFLLLGSRLRKKLLKVMLKHNAG